MSPPFVYAYNRTDMDNMTEVSLSRLLANAASTIAEQWRGAGATIDAIVVSVQANLLAGRLGDGLVDVQVLDILQRRYGDLFGRKVETYHVNAASNGLAAVTVACDIIHRHRTEGKECTVLVLGGEIMCDARGRYFEDLMPVIDSVISEEERRLGLTQRILVSLLIEAVLKANEISDADALKIRSWFLEHETWFAGRNLKAFADPEYMAPFPIRRSTFAGDVLGKNHPAMSNMNRYEVCAACNGAGAVLLSSRGEVGSRKPIARVMAVGTASDRSEVCRRDAPWRVLATRDAFDAAVDKAGFNPVLARGREVGRRLVVETHTPFSPLIIPNLIELGLESPATLRELAAVDMAENSRLAPLPEGHCHEWDYALNPSGGLKDGHPLGGTSIIKLVECLRRLDSATAEPVFRADLALCHALAGPGSSAGVVILQSVRNAWTPQKLRAAETAVAPEHEPERHAKEAAAFFRVQGRRAGSVPTEDRGSRTRLEGEQRTHLRRALIDAFRTPGDLRIFVSDHLGINLNAISSNGTLESVCFELVDWAESRGPAMVRKVVEGAVRDRPDNVLVAEVARSVAFDGQVDSPHDTTARSTAPAPSNSPRLCAIVHFPELAKSSPVMKLMFPGSGPKAPVAWFKTGFVWKGNPKHYLRASADQGFAVGLVAFSETEFVLAFPETQREADLRPESVRDNLPPVRMSQRGTGDDIFWTFALLP